MKKFYSNILLFSAILFFVSSTITIAQQVPERIPYTKHRNRTVSALPLTGITITPITPAQLVTYLLGPGASISNLTYTGSPLALGLFVDSAASIGLDTGIVISTGDVMSIPGPNDSGGTSTDLGTTGDSILSVISGFPTHDAAIIEFDVLVTTDTLSANFVFGSEEYNEFTNSNYNDLFAFFVSGPGITGTENIAYIPGTSTIISINTINNGLMNTGPCMNCQYYINNPPGSPDIEYDGYTTPFTLYRVIQNGQTYHFKIAIADGGDGIYDSGIFLKKGSVLGYASMPVPGFDPQVNGLTVEFTNTTNYAIYYTWDYGDGTADSTSQNITTHTYAQSGLYQVIMQAHNYYQVATCSQQLSVGGVGIPVITNNTPEIKVQNLGRGLYKINFGRPAIADLRIYAITGELMTTIESNNKPDVIINLGDLSKGLYILQINTPENTFTRKLIR